jgi:hypothetical protein
MPAPELLDLRELLPPQVLLLVRLEPIHQP